MSREDTDKSTKPASSTPGKGSQVTSTPPPPPGSDGASTPPPSVAPASPKARPAAAPGATTAVPGSGASGTGRTGKQPVTKPAGAKASTSKASAAKASTTASGTQSPATTPRAGATGAVRTGSVGTASVRTAAPAPAAAPTPPLTPLQPAAAAAAAATAFPAAAPTTSSATKKVSVGPRRVRLAVSRVDPWSAMKLSFLLSIAIGIMIVVATIIFWFVLDGMQVFTEIDNIVVDVLGKDTKVDILQYVEFKRVVSLATIIAIVDMVLLTALATIGAFLYNVVAALVGGVHLTLIDE